MDYYYSEWSFLPRAGLSSFENPFLEVLAARSNTALSSPEAILVYNLSALIIELRIVYENERRFEASVMCSNQ